MVTHCSVGYNGKRGETSQGRVSINREVIREVRYNYHITKTKNKKTTNEETMYGYGNICIVRTIVKQKQVLGLPWWHSG